MKISTLAKIVIIGSGMVTASASAHSSNGATWSWESDRNTSGEIAVGTRNGSSELIGEGSLPSFINIGKSIDGDMAFSYGIVSGSTVHLYHQPLDTWLEYSLDDFKAYFDYDYMGRPETLDVERDIYDLSITGITHRIEEGSFAQVHQPCIRYGDTGSWRYVTAHNESRSRRADLHDCLEIGDGFPFVKDHKQSCSINSLGMVISNNINMNEVIGDVGNSIYNAEYDTYIGVVNGELDFSLTALCHSNLFVEDRNNTVVTKTFHEYTPRDARYASPSPRRIRTPYCYSTGTLRNRWVNSYYFYTESCLNGGDEDPSIGVVPNAQYIDENGRRQNMDGLFETMDLMFSFRTKYGAEAELKSPISAGVSNGVHEVKLFTHTFHSANEDLYVTSNNIGVEECYGVNRRDVKCYKNIGSGITLYNGNDSPIEIPITYPYLGQQMSNASLTNTTSIAVETDFDILVLHNSGTSWGRVFPRNYIFNYKTGDQLSIPSDITHSVVGRDIIINARPNNAFFNRNQ